MGCGSSSEAVPPHHTAIPPNTLHEKHAPTTNPNPNATTNTHTPTQQAASNSKTSSGSGTTPGHAHKPSTSVPKRASKSDGKGSSTEPVTQHALGPPSHDAGHSRSHSHSRADKELTDTQITAVLAAPPTAAEKPKKGHTEDKYVVIKVLGEGASCKVLSVRDKWTNLLYAMKVMDKSESYNKTLFENENHILRLLRHPNILEFVDSYEDKHTYHLLTVLCQGGELFDKVKNGSFSEKKASVLAKSMLAALAYCHSHHVVHRDLKPENFVFEAPSDDSPMKLIDFGCAKVVRDEEAVQDVAGSPYYCAPEVLSESIVRTGAIWKAADLWSVGVIVFLLVCGYPPFNGDSQDKIFRKIKRGKYRFPKKSAGIDLSNAVKDLISQLLVMDPRKRLTAAQALQHPWITGDDAPDTPLPDSVIVALSSFRAQCRLKKAVGRVMGGRLTEDDRESLNAVFSQFDQNGDGRLGSEEIAQLMQHINGQHKGGGNKSSSMNSSDVEAMMSVLDEDGDGVVSMSELATAHAIGKLGSDSAEVKASFDMFDADHDGFVTHKEIEALCSFLTPEATRTLIQEVDADGDGRVNFNEWIKAMKGIDVRKMATVVKPAPASVAPSLATTAEEHETEEKPHS